MVEIRRTAVLQPHGEEYWYHVVVKLNYFEYMEKKGRHPPRLTPFVTTRQQVSANGEDFAALDKIALAEFGIDDGDGFVVEGLTLRSPYRARF